MSHPVVIVIIVMGLTTQSFVTEFSYKCGSVLVPFCPSHLLLTVLHQAWCDEDERNDEGITQQLGHTPSMERHNIIEPP